jgi:hypothetical protein
MVHISKFKIIIKFILWLFKKNKKLCSQIIIKLYYDIISKKKIVSTVFDN